MLLRRTFQNVSRATDIALILIKYGFEEVVANTSLKNVVGKKPSSWLRRHDPQFTDRSGAERLRMAIEELGTTFIKLAQVVSNRPDVLPTDLIKELEKLQNQVPAEPFDTVRSIVERELRLPLERLFPFFDPVPIGAASIGQVHRARLVSGQEVVVKVQRPNVATLVVRDLAIIKEVVRLSEAYFHRIGLLNPVEIVATFEKTLLKELDYTAEARNMTQFKAFYAANPAFYVPKAYPEYTTHHILVQEYVQGCKITDVARLALWQIAPATVVENGMNIYLSQIFEFGFFHADPHPGNILVQANGRICLIDFGMVGRLSQADKLHLGGVFVSMAQRDARSMARSLLQLSLEADVANARMLEADLSELIEDYVSLDVSQTNISQLATSLQRIIYQYHLKVPPSVFIILRAFAILEGIGKTIYPKFQFYEFLKPYGATLFKAQYGRAFVQQNLTNTASQLWALVNSLPYDVQDIVTKIAKGRLQVQVEQPSHHALLQQFAPALRRLVLAMLIVGLLVAAGLFAVAAQGTTALSNALLGIAMALAAWLLWSFWRE